MPWRRPGGASRAGRADYDKRVSDYRSASDPGDLHARANEVVVASHDALVEITEQIFPGILSKA